MHSFDADWQLGVRQTGYPGDTVEGQVQVCAEETLAWLSWDQSAGCSLAPAQEAPDAMAVLF